MVWTECTAASSIGQKKFLTQKTESLDQTRNLHSIEIKLKLDLLNCSERTILDASNQTVIYCEMDNCKATEKNISKDHDYRHRFILPDLKQSTDYIVSIELHSTFNTTQLFSSPIRVTTQTVSYRFYYVSIGILCCVVCILVGYYCWRKGQNMYIVAVMPMEFDYIYNVDKDNVSWNSVSTETDHPVKLMPRLSESEYIVKFYNRIRNIT